MAEERAPALAAERHRVPVFCWLAGRSQLLVPYLRAFARLQFILDHCGVGRRPIDWGRRRRHW